MEQPSRFDQYKWPAAIVSGGVVLAGATMVIIQQVGGAGSENPAAADVPSIGESYPSSISSHPNQLHQVVQRASPSERSSTSADSPDLPGPADIPSVSLTTPAPTSSSPSKKPEVLQPSCLEPQASSDMAHRLACQALRQGKIALVDVGTGGSYDIDKVGQMTQTALNNASMGLLTPKVVTFQATDAARAALKVREQIGPDGNRCLMPAPAADMPQDATYAPLTAIVLSKMPELRQYPVVISVGSEACDDQDRLGIANPLTRHDDAYLTPRATTLGGPLLPPSSAQLASAVTHEDLHFSLGHSGVVSGDECPAPTDSGSAVAIEPYLTKMCKYNQYGNNGNLMSWDGADPTASPEILLSDIQRDYLAQSAVDQQTPHGVPLEVGKAVDVSYDAGAQSTYVTLPLPKDAIKNKKLAGFRQLDLMATTTTDPYGNTVPAVQMMINTSFKPPAVFDENTSLMREAKLQEAIAIPESGELDFTLGGQTVVATRQDDGTIEFILR